MKLFGVALLLGLSVGSLRAQISGRVSDPAGRPLSLATVELFSPSGRVALQETDRSGSFSFAVAPAESLSLLLRRVGFVPVGAALIGGGGTSLRMPRFNRGSGSTRACPATSDPEALRLYGAMIDKYAVVPDTALRRVGARRLVAEVRVDSVGIVDSTRLRPMMVGGNSNIHREYARLPGSNVDPRIGRWVYPWLESIAAQHFIEGKFLEWNAVASGARSARGTILRFCSRRATPEHYIQGELVLGTGGNLLQADFRFVAPAGPENAGGSVFFLPISPGRVTRLRPVAGFFWRQQGDRYYTEWLEYQEWR